MANEKNCPRCGESVFIYDYAELRPNGVNVYYKCRKCWTSFNGKFFEYEKSINPFEKSDENEGSNKDD